jgi:hypothetical protein
MKAIVLFMALPVTILVWSFAVYGVIQFLGW